MIQQEAMKQIELQIRQITLIHRTLTYTAQVAQIQEGSQNLKK